MPKVKTKRAAAKRFKVTATGKVLRRRAFKSHILAKKTRKRKRALRRPALVADADLKRVKAMIPYMG
ncbi:MAG: 50S ribosomal protein L35 [Candidatus Hydrothermae bacterium]|nr:50S ribosomal protein L35 [Candidatus Hydrothermae bacterium]